MITLFANVGAPINAFDWYFTKLQYPLNAALRSPTKRLIIRFESPSLTGERQPDPGWSMRKSNVKQIVKFWYRVPLEAESWTLEETIAYVKTTIVDAIEKSAPAFKQFQILIDKDKITSTIESVFDALRREGVPGF